MLNVSLYCFNVLLIHWILYGMWKTMAVWVQMVGGVLAGDPRGRGGWLVAVPSAAQHKGKKILPGVLPAWGKDPNPTSEVRFPLTAYGFCTISKAEKLVGRSVVSWGLSCFLICHHGDIIIITLTNSEWRMYCFLSAFLILNWIYSSPNHCPCFLKAHLILFGCI